MADFNNALFWIQKQYFQGVAMKNFDWDKMRDLEMVGTTTDNAEQLSVLNATVLHPRSLKYPSSNAYKLSFLKSLLALYEEQEKEGCNELYNLIAELVAKKKNAENEFIYKSYFLSCGYAITLCESAQFVSQGTTGLNTWQAGLYLSNWLIQNKSELQGRRILELGCGVGLTGLVTLHCSRPKSYIFTDCNETVLNKVKENLQINGFFPSTSEQRHADIFETCYEESTEIREDSRSLLLPQDVAECRTCSRFKDDVLEEDCRVFVHQLDWERCDLEEVEKCSPDVVLASDVVFDPRIIEPLVNVIKVFLSRQDKDQRYQPVVYIASTIRNTDTYEYFLLALDKSGVTRNQIHSVPDESIYYNKTSDIVLLQLKLS